jgi:hypothetical protein
MDGVRLAALLPGLSGRGVVLADPADQHLLDERHG